MVPSVAFHRLFAAYAPRAKTSGAISPSSLVETAELEGGSFEPAVVPKSAEATKFLNEAARKVLLFSSLSEENFVETEGSVLAAVTLGKFAMGSLALVVSWSSQQFQTPRPGALEFRAGIFALLRKCWLAFSCWHLRAAPHVLDVLQLLASSLSAASVGWPAAAGIFAQRRMCSIPSPKR